MPPDDTRVLEEDVARASDEVQRAESLHEAVLEQRSVAQSAEEKHAEIAAWLRQMTD